MNLNSNKYANYIITYSVEFLVMLSGVVLFKQINSRFNDFGFSEFTINKRLIGFLMPLLMVGMGVAIPKFSSAEDRKIKTDIYYIALIIISISFALFLGICISLNSLFSFLVFGDDAHSKMFILVLLYVYTLLIHSCIYNYFRSNLDFKKASVIQLINLGIWPILIVFFVNTLLEYFVVLSSITMITSVLIHSLFIPFMSLKIQHFKSRFTPIFKYGVSRVPGDVLLGFFFALPVFLISTNFSMKEAGMVAFCLSLFNIVIALTSPINVLVLPIASKMVHEKNDKDLNVLRNRLLLSALLIGTAAVGVIVLFGSNVLMLFGISDVYQTKIYLLIVFTGVFGYSIFSLLRSIVDARSETAQIGYFIITAFVCFIILIAALFFFDLLSVNNILLSFAFSMNVLGVLTLNSLYWKKK